MLSHSQRSRTPEGGLWGALQARSTKFGRTKYVRKKCSKNKFELPKITFPSLCTRTNAHLSRLRRLREDYGETCVSLPPLECLTNKEKRNIQIKLNSKKLFTKHTLHIVKHSYNGHTMACSHSQSYWLLFKLKNKNML